MVSLRLKQVLLIGVKDSLSEAIKLLFPNNLNVDIQLQTYALSRTNRNLHFLQNRIHAIQSLGMILFVVILKFQL